ncbi:MAG: UDP-N-acetylmuramoyl-L-alanyl-D-glutamate--2,6-diaminopimelate ligase [Planctomycetes bacterium]|nr:UDP-N-acetylmuramoyl-L-alanyl-D-glutamate--2,6-diaminopimelate ligase [Planctomycetota bacterium]
MIAVENLFSGQSLSLVSGSMPLMVTGIARDSRQVRPGDVYVAMGSAAEQPAHAREAIARGACVVLAEHGLTLDASVPLLRTAHARWSFARASASAHGLPRRALPLVGVTGTAGKSTTTHCAWWAMGEGAARIGTIGWHDGVNERANAQTTPPPEQLHDFLAGLPSTCGGVAMEVSSHAGDQHRLAGLQFAALAFTGLGHDHLDYHRTLGAYLTAKLRALRLLRTGGLCVINADAPDAHAVAHAANGADARVVMLGFKRGDSRLVRTNSGWRIRHEAVDYRVPVRLPGDFNAWNAAAGALLATATGVPLQNGLARLASMPAVPGRLELLAHRPDTYVDYAHTPDELKVMLTAVRKEFPGRRLVCVFGCGGDRDRSKRGPMGCAALIADHVVLTTDNSRSEDPKAIAEEVIKGLPSGTEVYWAQSDDLASGRWLDEMRPVHGAKTRVSEAPRSLLVELDRGTAIRLARALAGNDGVVVVAGKGHETDQLLRGVTMPWDDRAFVRSLEVRP